MENKICNKCKQEKPLSEFSKGITYKDGIRARCKVCCNEDMRIFRIKHPDYRKGYREKGKIYRDKASTLEQKCFLCQSTKKLVVHHLDKNSNNNKLSNLSIVCRSCHNKIHHINIKHNYQH